MKNNKSLERKIDILSKNLESFENKLENTNRKIENLVSTIANGIIAQRMNEKMNERMNEKRFQVIRAKTERFGEHSELFEQTLSPENLNRIHGRHREILAMLINNGFHTYEQIASKLDISQSRARAYIAELKNDYHLPLRQVRDPEGYKVGIDVRFIEHILSK